MVTHDTTTLGDSPCRQEVSEPVDEGTGSRDIEQ